jgi:hypothetical protein
MKYSSYLPRKSDGITPDYSAARVYKTYQYNANRWSESAVYRWKLSTADRPIFTPYRPDRQNDPNSTTFWHRMTDDEAMRAPLTRLNSSGGARFSQATIFKRNGYHGPIQSGQARGLARILKLIGREDCVRRGWFIKSIPKVKYAGIQWQRDSTSDRLIGPVYLFKSPRQGVTFKDFALILKLYRPDNKDFQQTFRQVMASKDVKSDIEMLTAQDILGRLNF